MSIQHTKGRRLLLQIMGNLDPEKGGPYSKVDTSKKGPGTEIPRTGGRGNQRRQPSERRRPLRKLREKETPSDLTMKEVDKEAEEGANASSQA